MATKAIDKRTVQRLAAHFRGELLSSGDEAYEGSRKIWNGAIERRPALIARCTS